MAKEASVIHTNATFALKSLISKHKEMIMNHAVAVVKSKIRNRIMNQSLTQILV